jgi:hypothetical protein
MPLLLHNVRVQHAFLLQIVRDRILRQQRRLHANFRAHPFTLSVGRVGRVIAWTSRAELGTKRGILDLIELLEVAPRLVADGPSNIDL